MKTAYQLKLEHRIAMLQADLDISYDKTAYFEWSNCLEMLRDYLNEKENRRLDQAKDDKATGGAE